MKKLKNKKIENYEDEFITINHIESKPKTEVFEVWSKCSSSPLGVIKWHPNWRHYTFQDEVIILSDRCLDALATFVKKCNRKHKFKQALEKLKK